MIFLNHKTLIQFIYNLHLLLYYIALLLIKVDRLNSITDL